MTTDVIRKTVPLTERDLEDIAKLRGTPTGKAALAVIGVDPADSEGQMLHGFLLWGIRAAQHEQEAAGYEALAADPEYQAEVAARRGARAARARRHPEAE